jgi:hypothetical protein
MDGADRRRPLLAALQRLLLWRFITPPSETSCGLGAATAHSGRSLFLPPGAAMSFPGIFIQPPPAAQAPLRRDARKGKLLRPERRGTGPGNPMAQYLWGKVLVETGQEHRDPWMIRESWAHLRWRATRLAED